MMHGPVNLRDVGVTGSKTIDEITRNLYWNELKLLLYTTEQPHGDIVTAVRFVVV